MQAYTLLSGSFVTPVQPLGASSWQFASAIRRHGRYRHLIILQLTAGLAPTLTRALLRSMHHNIVLDGLQQGQHYQWGGFSVIGFRSKANAALFRLFTLPPDDRC